MHAIDLLTRQHRHVERLFDRLERGAIPDPQERGETFARLVDALALHLALEEDHVYPRAEALRRPDAQEEALSEHQELKERLADLLQLDPADPAFDAKLLALRDTLEVHLEEEESELFPLLEAHLGEAELLELGLTLAAETRERGGFPDGDVAPLLDPGAG
jgi:hemerythrin-like domain-containing protein